MHETDAAAAAAVAMAAAGMRRLLVLSGDAPWCLEQARRLRERLGGDGLWVSPDAAPEPCCPPAALARLLGREFHHAFFDALSGFDASAFAALAGTLTPGSWLVLLAPPLAQWPALPDADSTRWNDAGEPIPAPRFIHHLCRTARSDPDTVIWQQGQPLALPDWPPRPAWRPASGAPLAEQAAVLDALAQMPPGAAVVTAGRGRGKSALAGMHLRSLRGTAIVTAPAKGATDVLASFAGERFRFMAPDALLAADARADWLIVDEAAAIPGPLLEALVRRFPRALLTTTVQGYEGTGRGFLLKVCARLSPVRTFSLEAPVRWASGCPLEALVARVLLFDDALPEAPADGGTTVAPVGQDAWLTAPALPIAMYRLLSAAHYRTSPLDLRRMMDAEGQRFTCALRSGALIGALWMVDEGGLSPALSRAVWAGFRRPRGNLVAQSLAAHGASPLAATLRGRRITRIAVHPRRQGEGIGRQMVADAVTGAGGLDYLSVSFGYTADLARFWARCGFTLVRVGTHREASSGCYSAMALLPLSDDGRALAAREREKMRRDAPWLDAWRDLHLAEGEAVEEAILSDGDWPELASFAWAHRPLLAAAGSLNRLALASPLPLPLLRATLSRQDEATLMQAHKIGGRRALLAALRDEAAAALASLDPARARALAQQVADCNFFH